MMCWTQAGRGGVAGDPEKGRLTAALFWCSQGQHRVGGMSYSVKAIPEDLPTAEPSCWPVVLAPGSL